MAANLNNTNAPDVYNGGTEAVPVGVPTDDDMATEPALTLANAQKILNAIVLFIGVVGIKLSPDIAGAAGDLLPYLFGAGTIIYGIYAAHRQGVMTRAAVYAPETVSNKVAAASRATRAMNPPPGPSAHMPGTTTA